MKHSLQLKLSQHLTLTPQLQQSIRLLQLSTVELNQELERYLAENPLLERADIPGGDEAGSPPPPKGADPAAEAAPTSEENARDESPSLVEENAAYNDDNGPVGASSARREDDDRDDFTQFAAAEPTLHEHLMQQISLTGLTPRDKLIAEFVVGHLDEDGYLKQELEELRDAAIAAMSDVEIEELQIALRHVQNLEPTGVGARDVAECLELQLKALPAATEHRDLAIT